MFLTRLASLAVVCLLITPVSAARTQQAGSPPPQQKPPVFRGEAVLVTVDVYPQRDGRIVEGLTAADFELLEDGKAQTIESAEFVRIEPAPPDAARRDPNTQGEMLALAADPKNRVFVTFLDIHHTSVQGSHALRRPFVDLLERVLGPTDLFGVTTSQIDPKLLVLGRRMPSIEEQLSRYWSWGRRDGLTTDPENPIETDLYHCFHEYFNGVDWVPWTVDDEGELRWFHDVLIDRNREDKALASLEQLIDQLAGLREARTVVFVVSDGWRLYQRNESYSNEMMKARGGAPSPGSAQGRLTMPPVADVAKTRASCNTEMLRLARLDNPARMRALIDAANRHNITLYPISPSGLDVFDVRPSSRTIPPGGKGLSATSNAERRSTRIEALRTIAGATGGLAVVDSNDLGAGLKRVIDDVSAYYLLTYYSTNTKNDGRFRAISVKTKTPGLHTRARRGYLAPSDTPSRTAGGIAGAARPLAGTAAPPEITAALAPLSRLSPSTELFSYVARDANGVWVVAELPSSQAASAPWASGAELQVVITDETGTAVGEGSAKLTAPARGGMVRVETRGKGPDALRVVSKLIAAGRVLEDRTEVPAVAAAGSVGPAVLFRATPAATSPLRPVADLQYRRTERVHVQWGLVSPGVLGERSARLLSRTGQPLAIPVRLTERDVEGRPVLAADVNLAPLAAGDYVIELKVTDASGPARTLVGFRVVQ